VELYANRKTRGSDRISSNEIESIAKRFNINLKKWRLSGHCLLNRDAEGNYKFAHRSIMEFLFTQRILENDPEALNVPIKDWTEQVKSFLHDGLEKRPWRFPVYFVPFTRKSWQIGEKGKTVEIRPFEISIYPITNREYEEFNPSHRNKRNEYSDNDDQPVVNITWEEADRYCRWLSEKTGDNYRLPQEIEWEFVASGGGQRKYPWGDEKPSKELANYIDSKIMKTKPVDSYPLGMTPEGLFSMAGNVWEWCDDWYNKKQKFRVIRGGSFFDLEHYLHCVYRIGADCNECTNYIGFRVVRDAN
jgi:serine/threonine-protein kinase